MKTDNRIELRGEIIESFERIDQIKEVILLGKNGEIRRIILDKNNKRI